MSWDIDLVGELDGHPVTLGFWNYTHNTNKMIRAAGFEDWGMDALDGMNAGLFAEQLREAIAHLRGEPSTYRAMNPENGWGDYDSLLEVLRKMEVEVNKYPSATISASF